MKTLFLLIKNERISPLLCLVLCFGASFDVSFYTFLFL
jgi:hypothetical protein